MKNFNIDGISKEMKKLSLWCYANGKIPCDIDGKFFKNTEREKFPRYSFEKVTTTNDLGLTFQLRGDIVCIDLDNCFDNPFDVEPKDWAKEIIDHAMEQKVTIEYSMSGLGLHIFCRRSKKHDKLKKLQMKLYKTHSKYKNLEETKDGIDLMFCNETICVTGNLYKNKLDDKLCMSKEFDKHIKDVELLSKIDITKTKEKHKKNQENKNVKKNSDYINNQFDFIKSEIDIMELIDQYDDLEPISNNNMMLCPFHSENTPSLHIYEMSNSWYCFGCGKGGSIIDFVMEKEDLTNFQALKRIAEMFNIEMDFHTNNIKTDAGHEAFYHYYHDNKLKLDYDELVKHIQDDGNHVTFNTPNGFYSYNDGFYERLSKNNIKQKLIEKHVAKQFKSSSCVNEVFERLCRNEKKVNILNNFNDLLIFNNCVLKFDMKGNYEIKDHNHSYLNTYRFNVDYENNTKCLTWEKFLNDILPKDQQKILQEIIGYVLLPDNSAKKFFALYGVGDSGKSVILRVIQKILGSELTSSITLQRLSNPNSQFDTSSLYGKLANIIGDLSSAPLQDTSIIKMLTGDDVINAQEKFGRPFDFYNKARLICSMNNLPKVIDKNNEFYKRLLIIPFEVAIPVEKQDKKLIDKFNFTGIVNWAIEGLQRLLNNNLNFSTNSVNDSVLNQYIKDNNNVMQFVDEALEVINSTNNMGVKLKDAYDYYRMFCHENGYSPLGRNKFKTEIQNCNITYSEHCKDRQGNRFRGFKNISFKEKIKSEYLRLI